MAAARTASTPTLHASFFGEGRRPLGELGPHEGILVPALAIYRFRCRGETLIARFAAGQA